MFEAGSCTLAALLAPEIVFVVAGKDFDAAVPDFKNPRGQLVDEIAVVRDKDHGAGELAERLEQNIFGAKVQVVGGLVEEQKIRWMQQHAGQRVAVTLAAGKHADGLENVVLGEEKATEQ